MGWVVLCLVAQSCLTLCDPMDRGAWQSSCSPPGSSVHGILQARIVEWVAMPSSRGSSQPRDQTQVSHLVGGFFTIWATREAQEYWRGYPTPSPGDLRFPGIELGSPALQVDPLPAELPGKPRGECWDTGNIWVKSGGVLIHLEPRKEDREPGTGCMEKAKPRAQRCSAHTDSSSAFFLFFFFLLKNGTNLHTQPVVTKARTTVPCRSLTYGYMECMASPWSILPKVYTLNLMRILDSTSSLSKYRGRGTDNSRNKVAIFHITRIWRHKNQM